jgi:hypothetical protein
MAERQPRQGIPTNLSVAQFEQFVLPHLSKGRVGPTKKTELSRDLQLHFAFAPPGLPVEGPASNSIRNNYADSEKS